MDGSGYPNALSSSSYPAPPSSSAQSMQQGSLPAHTLPPLQHPGPALQQQAYNYHTGRTPTTPGTPVTSGGMAYPPPPTTNGARSSYQMMPNSAYQQQPTHQSYAASSSMLSQTSAALSHPQPIAPAPPSGSRGPPTLRPMPSGGVIQQAGMTSPYGHGQSPLMAQPTMLADGEPTHVVGSQGRRGILPSEPGRPPAPAAGSVAKNQIPPKDENGKFPCPHCNKSYLHAKHLKRHLLRRKS